MAKKKKKTQPAKDSKEETKSKEQAKPQQKNDDQGHTASQDGDPGVVSSRSDKTDSEQGPPQNEGVEPVDPWVLDIIHNEAQKAGHDDMDKLFTSDSPDFESVRRFFNDLNQKIMQANKEHNVDENKGKIPFSSLLGMHEAWMALVVKARAEKSPQLGWRAFEDTHGKLAAFNRKYHLPEEWNLIANTAEMLFGPRPEMELDTSSMNESSESDSDTETVTGIDALESRAFKEQRATSGGKVLYWWKKGTGSQTFVRYGSSKAPIYRIRAGSFELYNSEVVPRVTSKSRGTQKKKEDDSWAYSRKDVADILCVGWKIEDDDERDIDPLELIEPDPYAIYPQTRILVRWKDGKETLEGRQFIRRITHGSSLAGDMVIYQRAKEHEDGYHIYQGQKERDPDSVPVRNARRSGKHAPRKGRVPLQYDDKSEDVSESGASSAGRSKAHASTRSKAKRPNKSNTVDSDSETPSKPRSKPRSRVMPHSQAKRSNRAHTPSLREDPRDVEIRELRAQLQDITSRESRKYNSAYHRPTRRQRHDEDYVYDDDYRSEVSSKPPLPLLPPRRMRRARYGNGPWDQWTTSNRSRRSGY